MGTAPKPCSGCRRQSDVSLSKHLTRMRLIRPGGWTHGRWCSAVHFALDRGPYGAGYRQPRRSRTAPCRRQAAATARGLGQHLVCWPDKPQVRFPGLCTLTGHSGYVLSVAYSPDGKHIVSGSRDNTVKIWDAQSGEEVRVVV